MEDAHKKGVFLVVGPLRKTTYQFKKNDQILMNH